MRYVEEFRDPAAVRALADTITREATRRWRIMEVCGGQTHAIARFGIDELVPSVTLLHGPGCPVCVTPAEAIDEAVALAQRPDVTLCTYGDMLRVPGVRGDLRGARAAGADVRVVYAATDALALASAMPAREVVFFAVGFETTAPGHAAVVREARRRAVRNFSLLASHVRVPPALEHILDAPERPVDAFLAAGHVCAIQGTTEYLPIAHSRGVPIVVTGFEPVDILQGVLACVRQLEAGLASVEIAYARAVRPEGNAAARAAVEEVFTTASQRWRGLGTLPDSGLRFREAWADVDARARFGLAPWREGTADDACRAGLVLLGRIRPAECPHFGVGCTPDTPMGPTMVSSEGACAAWFRYRRAP